MIASVNMGCFWKFLFELIVNFYCNLNSVELKLGTYALCIIMIVLCSPSESMTAFVVNAVRLRIYDGKILLPKKYLIVSIFVLQFSQFDVILSDEQHCSYATFLV